MPQRGVPWRPTMPQQPNLFTPEPEESRSYARPAPVPRGGRAHPRHLWLERTELLVRVVVQLYLGLLIVALPWMRFWTENGLLSWTHATAMVANNGFVRGAVSGLGMLNVLLALHALFADKPRR